MFLSDAIYATRCNWCNLGVVLFWFKKEIIDFKLISEEGFCDPSLPR